MPISISAVTATLNRRDYLPRCIESVASQEYLNKEHVIIDGGSTDGTVELLQEYSARYSHLRFISEKDNGLSDAFNKGLTLASGDAIGVIGDDDYYEPGAFEVVARAFAENPDAGLVVGGCRFFRNDGSTERIAPARYTNRRDLIECWRHWGKRVSIAAPSTFIRREVIEDVGGFDTADRYAMDYRHWIKITEKHSIVTIPQVLANFRSDIGTISHTLHEKQWRETLAISRQYWKTNGEREYRRLVISFLLYCGLRRGKRILKPLIKPAVKLCRRKA